MTETITRSAPRVRFRKAWNRSPEDDDHQLTHAVDSGLGTALCGVGTRVRRGDWPVDATVWDSPLGRCPACARAVYGSRERRH